MVRHTTTPPPWTYHHATAWAQTWQGLQSLAQTFTPALGLGFPRQGLQPSLRHTRMAPVLWASRDQAKRPAHAGPQPVSSLGPNANLVAVEGVLSQPMACNHPPRLFWAVSFSPQGTPCHPTPTAQSPKLFWGSNFDPIILCSYYFASTIDPVWPNLLN